MVVRVDVTGAAEWSERSQGYEVFHWAIDAQREMKMKMGQEQEGKDLQGRRSMSTALLEYGQATISCSVEEIEKEWWIVENCRAIPLRQATNPVRLSRVRGFDAIEAWRF